MSLENTDGRTDMQDGSDSVNEVEARVALRESFLRAINELYGQPCKILTYEQSQLQADFIAWNIDGSEVLVRNLQTPSQHTVESALLRTPDLLALQFDKSLHS